MNFIHPCFSSFLYSLNHDTALSATLDELKFLQFTEATFIENKAAIFCPGALYCSIGKLIKLSWFPSKIVSITFLNIEWLKRESLLVLRHLSWPNRQVRTFNSACFLKSSFHDILRIRTAELQWAIFPIAIWFRQKLCTSTSAFLYLPVMETICGFLQPEPHPWESFFF